MPAAASYQGVPALAAPHPPRGEEGPRRASRARQLRDAQDGRGVGAAGEAPAFLWSLHADQPLVAEPRRALLCRARASHPRLSRSSQRKAEAVRVDQIRRGHPGQGGPRQSRARRHQNQLPSVRIRALALEESNGARTIAMAHPRLGQPLPNWVCFAVAALGQHTKVGRNRLERRTIAPASSGQPSRWSDGPHGAVI